MLLTAAERSSYALEDVLIAPQVLVSVALEDTSWTLPYHNACHVDLTVQPAAARHTHHVLAVFLTLTSLPTALAYDVIAAALLAAALQPPALAVVQV